MAAAAPEVPRPLRVYLVEDSEVLRRLLVPAIEVGGGAEVIGSCDNAPGAIADLSTLQPNVIVIDIALASGNGFDVLTALQDHNLVPDAVKVVLTNYPTREYRERSERLGADRFFDKSETWQALTFIRGLAAQGRTSNPSGRSSSG